MNILLLLYNILKETISILLFNYSLYSCQVIFLYYIQLLIELIKLIVQRLLRNGGGSDPKTAIGGKFD